MKDASVYEAALEVKEAIYNVGGQLGEVMAKLGSRLKGLQRREVWAGELFARLLDGAAGYDGTMDQVQLKRRKRLAQLAWELAGILDDADPQRGSSPAAGQGDDEGGGIDLAAGALDDE